MVQAKQSLNDWGLEGPRRATVDRQRSRKTDKQNEMQSKLTLTNCGQSKDSTELFIKLLRLAEAFCETPKFAASDPNKRWISSSFFKRMAEKAEGRETGTPTLN